MHGSKVITTNQQVNIEEIELATDEKTLQASMLQRFKHQHGNGGTVEGDAQDRCCNNRTEQWMMRPMGGGCVGRLVHSISEGIQLLS